ncbi:MAG: ketosteroid isomerase-related protein [Pseudomonadota bacterium]
MAAAETKTLIQRYYDAFNTGDWDAMAALVGEDVAHDINQNGREIGRDMFRNFLGRMALHYDEQLADIEVFVSESGNRAAAEMTVRGTYKITADGLPEAKGQTYALPVGQFFDIEDGLVTRVSTHYNLKDWVAQVAK